MAMVMNKWVVLGAIGAAGVISGCSSAHRNIEAETAETREQGSFLPGSDDDRQQGQIASYIDRGSSWEKSAANRRAEAKSEPKREQPVTTSQAAPVDQHHAQAMMNLNGSEHFKTDSAELNGEGRKELARVGALLSASEGRKIVVEGYADSTGSRAYNQDLSKRRAESVRHALIEMGASPDQISIRPMGEEHPIATNDTEEGRAQNRRVEIHPAG